MPSTEFKQVKDGANIAQENHLKIYEGKEIKPEQIVSLCHDTNKANGQAYSLNIGAYSISIDESYFYNALSIMQDEGENVVSARQMQHSGQVKEGAGRFYYLNMRHFAPEFDNMAPSAFVLRPKEGFGSKFLPVDDNGKPLSNKQAINREIIEEDYGAQRMISSGMDLD